MPSIKVLTEAEWLASDNPNFMVGSLPSNFDERRRRLFACACCHLLKPLLEDQRIVDALAIAERYAEGNATAAELEAAQKLANKAQRAQRRNALLLAYSAVSDTCFKYLGGYHLFVSADKVAEALLLAREPRIDAAKRRSAIALERAPLSDLLREVAGNPFRQVQLDGKWLTSNSGAVTNLARSIYDQQDFQRMHELGDAFEQAGCNNPDVLNHCRQPVNHVRGCWLIDLILA